MQPFVHLHSHTEFSLLDGISRLPDMVRRAKGVKSAGPCHYRPRQYVRSHLFLQRMYGPRR